MAISFRSSRPVFRRFAATARTIRLAISTAIVDRRRATISPIGRTRAGPIAVDLIRSTLRISSLQRTPTAGSISGLVSLSRLVALSFSRIISFAFAFAFSRIVSVSVLLSGGCTIVATIRVLGRHFSLLSARVVHRRSVTLRIRVRTANWRPIISRW